MGFFEIRKAARRLLISFERLQGITGIIRQTLFYVEVISLNTEGKRVYEQLDNNQTFTLNYGEFYLYLGSFMLKSELWEMFRIIILMGSRLTGACDHKLSIIYLRGT